MDEADKVGVLVVVESTLATAAAASGVPALGLTAGVVPLVEHYLSRAVGRQDHVNQLVNDAISIAGSTPEDYLNWVQDNDRNLTLFHSTMEAAWSTFDRDKVRALSRVLADAFIDEARVDLDTFIVKALRDFEPPHVRTLKLLYAAHRVGPGQFGERLAGLREAADPIVSSLERHGCCKRNVAMDYDREVPEPTEDGYGDTEWWILTPFGLECLRAIDLDGTALNLA